jgi:hypothetical protein
MSHGQTYRHTGGRQFRSSASVEESRTDKKRGHGGGGGEERGETVPHKTLLRNAILQLCNLPCRQAAAEMVNTVALVSRFACIRVCTGVTRHFSKVR